MINGVVSVLRIGRAVGAGVLGEKEEAQPRLVGGGYAHRFILMGDHAPILGDTGDRRGTLMLQIPERFVAPR